MNLNPSMPRHRSPSVMRGPQIFTSPLDMLLTDVFVEIRDLEVAPVFVKCEGFNMVGSIKLKPALEMIVALEKSYRLGPRSKIIESSSGNLGVALSMICAERGYPFICVTDPASSETNRKLIRAFGGQVIVVQERDANGGFLQTRIDLIMRMCADDPSIIWLNQYKNESNVKAHERTTARELLWGFNKIDWLFVPAGTTGTLMGCARYFRRHSPATRVVAVDSEGSVTFGGKPGKRYIPGIGTSSVPEILDRGLVDEVVMVPEIDTVRMCRRLVQRGYLFGGSTGTALAGIEACAARIQLDQTIVTISPDLGERYIDTVYDDGWARKYFSILFEQSMNK